MGIDTVYLFSYNSFNLCKKCIVLALDSSIINNILLILLIHIYQSSKWNNNDVIHTFLFNIFEREILFVQPIHQWTATTKIYLVHNFLQNMCFCDLFSNTSYAFIKFNNGYICLCKKFIIKVFLY